MDEKEHSLVPFPVILLQQLEIFKTQNEGMKIQEATEEQIEEFQNQVKSASKNFEEERNFQEAVRNAHLLFEKPKIPEQVQKLFTSCDDMEDEDCNDFWLLVPRPDTFGALPVL